MMYLYCGRDRVLNVVLLILFIGSAVLPVGFTNGASETYRLSLSWPSFRLSSPTCVAIDTKGNIYIADTGSHSIQKLTSKGELIAKWGNSGSGDGQFGDGSPACLTVDGFGNIYVLDIGNCRVQKFTSNGTFITKWGSEGFGDGQFRRWFVQPESYGIDIDSYGNIYVTDPGNSRIQKFTSDGIFLAKWGSVGSGDGQFSEGSPLGVTVDGFGNVYVSDTLNKRIQKFKSDGTFITKWGIPDAVNYLFLPFDLTVDVLGNVYVVESECRCISKFNSEGILITKWGGFDKPDLFGCPTGIAVDVSGDIYVTDSENRCIKKFTSNGTIITKWSGDQGSEDGQFYYPYGVAVDSFGNVYVADTENKRIQKFTSDGTFITKWGSAGSGDGQFGGDTDYGPWGVAVDVSGNVYVTDFGNSSIQKFTLNGEFIAKWGSLGTLDCFFHFPRGIAVDTSGNVYVADTVNGRIQKFTSDGTFITKWGSYGSGDGQFLGPVSVAVDSSDNVYVSDWQNYRIQKFTSNGTFITKWGSKGSGDGQFGSSVGGHPNIPGLAVDIVGNVYASDAGNNRIQKFTSNGTFITKWGSVGSGNLELNAPEGLAVDLQGSVYVVDRLNNRIQKYNIIVPENLKITVKDKDGIPVMGATISSTAQPSGQPALSGVTGADGATTFSGVLPGDYSFEVSKDIYNTQNIQVRVTSAQITDISVRLERTLSFTYSDLSVTPAEAKPGDAVAVSVTVKNIGDQSGAYSVELKLDGATKETKTGILNGGASVTVTFTVSGAAEGIHTVAVGALSESFKVKTPLKPAAISVKTLQISKTLAKPGEEIEVTVTLENTGEQSGSYDLVISLDGVEKDSSTVTLEGGKTVAKTVKLSSGFEGVHKVTVDGKSIEFEVKKESSGIDGFPFEAVAIGLMIAVLLLVVYRKS